MHKGNEHENQGPMTRGKRKRQEVSGKPVADISFANYTHQITDPHNKEEELRHILLANIPNDPASYKEAIEDTERVKRSSKI